MTLLAEISEAHRREDDRTAGEPRVKVHYCGVQGLDASAPGPEFVTDRRHTSCVAVGHRAEAAPSLILDAGTGIRSVSIPLGGAPFVGTILLTHLHWDHVRACRSSRRRIRVDARVHLLLPDQGDGSRRADRPVDRCRHRTFRSAPGLRGTVDVRRDPRRAPMRSRAAR